MTYPIYVPQHHSARLARGLIKYQGISGLFTDWFSSCNIIAFIGQEKISLMHADNNAAFNLTAVIKEEIEWVGTDVEVVVIYRKEGNFLKEKLEMEFQENFANIVLKFEKVAEAVTGIYLSFNENENNNIHPFIEIYKDNAVPENLLRHPQESRFNNIVRIEQVIGARARNLVTGHLLKKTCIFNGFAWQKFSDNELALDLAHPLTRKEMVNFSAEMDYFCLMRNLVPLVGEINQALDFGGTALDNANCIIEFLENYLNPDKTPDELLQRNLRALISIEVMEADGESLSEKDKVFINDIEKHLENYSFETVSAFLDETKKKTDNTILINELLAKSENIILHYLLRMEYMDLYEQYQQQRDRAAEYIGKASQHLIHNETAAAINLAKEAMQLLIHSSLEGPVFANYYCVLGLALMRNQDYAIAKQFLETSGDLQVQYNIDLSSRQRVKLALAKCEMQINETTINKNKIEL